MRRKRSWLLAASILLICAGSQGCAQMIRNWPPWLDFTPPPSTYRVTAWRSHYPRHTRKHVRIADHSASWPEASQARTSPIEPADFPPIQVPAELTLSGENRDHARAADLLRSTDLRLAALRKHSLYASHSAAYRRAHALADRAHRALADGDYLAASSLARKASALADGIGKSD